MSCADRLKEKFRIFKIDTSTGTSAGPKKTAEDVATIVLDLIEKELQEEILHLPKPLVAATFNGRTFLETDAAQQLVDKFCQEGSYAPREQVEADMSLVQAIPGVVVRNKGGDVLRLKRRERNTASKLHEKIVIWAGGHVRIEDGKNGAAILRCAMRELKEELRLSVEADELVLIGAVYVDLKDSAKHVAFVYEWRAATDDVAVSLSNGEFFERRGNSVSGKFVPVSELAKEFTDVAESEPWSFEILKRLMPNADGSLGHLF